MTDKNTLDLARQWAAGIDADRQTLSQDMIDAAAEVIRGLPDEWVSTDKLRELIERWRSSKNEYRLPVQTAYETVASDLDALLPAPTPRVEIALGAWAMHPEHGKVLIASTHDWEDDVRVVVENRSKDTDIGSWQAWVSPADLSPVPSDTPTEQDSHCERDTSVNASVNTSHDEPQDGEAWLIEVAGEHLNAVVAGAGFLYVDVIRTWTPAHSVTPICRMVPEQQPRHCPPDRPVVARSSQRSGGDQCLVM